MLKEMVLREFEGQVVIDYNELYPSDWVTLLNMRRKIKEKQYKQIQELEKSNKNLETGTKNITKETNLASRRMQNISHMMKNAPRG